MSLNENIFLYSVPNFSKHKNKLIELIYEIPINGLYCNEQRIYHQDYNLPPGFTRSYYNYFVNNIYPNFHSEFCNINKTTFSLEHTWFQIYKKNDFHKWHIHGKCHFTNIFYINLPNESVKTEIDNFGEKFTAEVKEGDILTIPSYWKHCSPINSSDQDKIIISFNSSVIL